MTTAAASAPVLKVPEQLQGGLRWPYLVAVCLSAFLLFQVQLVLGKYFLPWFGGTPAVWTTCMFFFQTLLVLGYVYAHTLARAPLKLQGRAHLVILALALLFSSFSAIKWHSPILPDGSWKPVGPENPIHRLVLLLGLSAGIPYLTLSATGPLLQSWFARSYGISPYRLYSLSNLGSFLALLSYPFAVEPWVPLKAQALSWFVGFVAFVLCCGYCSLQLGERTHAATPSVLSPEEKHILAPGSRLGTYCLWLMLSASGSILFLSTTNQICQDIAVVPLLWILPLAVYLASLVICFDKPRYYQRRLWYPGFAVALAVAVFLLNGGSLTHIVRQIVAYAFVLFAGCMVCHGELAKSKPPVRHLTLFYLMVSIGGALGGVFVVLIAPRVFTSFAEYQLGLWLTAFLMLLAAIRDRDSWVYESRFGVLLIALTTAIFPGIAAVVLHGKLALDYFLLLGLVTTALLLVSSKTRTGFSPTKRHASLLFSLFALVVLAAVFILSARMQAKESLLRLRNFYGVLSVKEINAENPYWDAYRLSHGRISHGFQFRSGSKSLLPTSYYGIDSGVGQAMTVLRRTRGPNQAPKLRLGVIGLGVGTIAAYSISGDYLHFYEINPDVIRIAQDQNFFTYLKNCPATVIVTGGDARLSLERELKNSSPQNFDLMVIDAFTGDAPPIHLLTREAFEIYMAHLAQGGILAVNITNTFVDLQPVVAGLADAMQLNSAFLHTDGDGRVTVYSDWMLLSRAPLSFNDSAGSHGKSSDKTVLWTDDYSNLFKVIR